MLACMQEELERQRLYAFATAAVAFAAWVVTLFS
jgi:hypothetical protein